jgi:hypothetical protein
MSRPGGRQVRGLGILALVALGLVGATVGARLALVARRTRGLPELAMGVGLLCVTALGLPLTAVARLPGVVATPAGDALFGVGLAFSLTGILLVHVFTWRVFRPDSAWARAGLVLAGAALVVEWLGMMHASGRGTTLEEILPHTRPWAIAVVATVAVAFTWTAAESLHYHALLRRRMALGLADPVVANRFLLWAVGGVATALLCVALVACMRAGLAPLRHPVPLAIISVAGIATSVAWSLAFLPPTAYLRWVRARAQSGAAGALG